MGFRVAAEDWCHELTNHEKTHDVDESVVQASLARARQGCRIAGRGALVVQAHRASELAQMD